MSIFHTTWLVKMRQRDKDLRVVGFAKQEEILM